MTEKEKQEIINIVHRTVLGFFDRSLDEEMYLTETEKTLLEVNKAICNGVKEMPTVEQRPHGEWIPCSERFPKPDKYVLVCSDEGNIEVAKGYISTEIEEFVWLTSGWRFGEVIAWMPLPKPYKEEGDRNEQTTD